MSLVLRSPHSALGDSRAGCLARMEPKRLLNPTARRNLIAAHGLLRNLSCEEIETKPDARRLGRVARAHSRPGFGKHPPLGGRPRRQNIEACNLFLLRRW